MFELPKTFGRYRLLEFLGQGAMAEVYRASVAGPLGFSKSFAVKVVPPHLAREETLVAAMVNEARLGALLHHPNVVEVLDFNRHDGCFYLAMEYIDGVNLDDLLAFHRRRQRFVPPGAALEIGRQACAGLAHAHGARGRDGEPVGLVHRDLKPGNLRLSTEGVVKVLDFGIARASERFGAATSVGVTKGTPLYMSPEQVTGREISAASDLFSLGAVLYEVITLGQLFAGDNLAHILNRVLRADTRAAAREADERLPGIGPVLRRATARSPDARYPSAAEMGDALAALLRNIEPTGSFDLRPIVAEVRAAQEAARSAGAAETREVDLRRLAGMESGRFPVQREPLLRRRATWAVGGAGALVLAGALAVAFGPWGPSREGGVSPASPGSGGGPGGAGAGRTSPTQELSRGTPAASTGPVPVPTPASEPGAPALPSPTPAVALPPPVRPGTPSPPTGKRPAQGEGAKGEPAGPGASEAPEPGSLLIDSGTLMYVAIDGGRGEEAPLLGRPISAGRHVIEYRPAGCERRSEEVEIAPGEVLKRRVECREGVIEVVRIPS
ncbi:protein kinase [Myxococcota bacterium]|nr:protein kinase [Myxococcota bacterium]